MEFSIDKQSLHDLELFNERNKQISVFSFYNYALTKGGQELLYHIFSTPSSDLEFLNNRRNEISFFFDNECYLKLYPRSIDNIAYYLTIRRDPLRANIIDATVDGLSNKINPSNDYFIISESITLIIQLLIDLKKFIESVKSLKLPHSIEKQLNKHIAGCAFGRSFFKSQMV